MSSIESRLSSSTRITHYWLPVLLMLMVQYTFSTSAFSSDETSKVFIPLLRLLLHNPTREQLLFWHHVIRKCAHVTEYCMLAILVHRAFKVYISKPAVVRLLTMAFIAFTALVDEFHQWFVPSRGSSIFDVGWDCIGGLIALTLIWIWRTAGAIEE
jgi:VanZ family protein